MYMRANYLADDRPDVRFAKHLDQVKMWKHVAALGFEERDGKSELSLKAAL